jgi:hypothetical protein
VVRTADLDEPVVRALPGPPLRELLEPALWVLQECGSDVGLDLGCGEAGQPGPHGSPALVEKDGSRESLEGGGQERRACPPSTLYLAFAEEQVLAEVDAPGQLRQAAGAHDRRAARGQDPLVVVRVAAVQGLRHHEADDCISQEFQALVVAGRLVRVLVKPGAVDESAGEERLVAEGDPE